VEYCHRVTKPYTNIYFDTSGLTDDEVIQETGLDKITKVLTSSAKTRPQSIVFGTDYAMCDITKHVKLIESLKISKETKDKIFSENAIRLFRLGVN